MSGPNLSDEFVDILYELSEGDLRILDRYEVGQKLALDKKQTDAVVEELYGKRQLQKIPGTRIVLTPAVKEDLESKKSIL
jgi:hypothetical protein